MRTPIIAGNWKMHKTATESVAFVQELAPALAPYSSVERVVCPTFVALAGVAEVLRGTDVKVGAQNVSTAESGAYTSQIAASMLAGLAEYVIIGHSEVRQYLGETDAMVNQKAKLLLAHDLKPIIACGESLEINQANQTAAHVEAQIRAAFDGISAFALPQIVVAYEPIWAIGTGLNASPDFAQQVIGGTIRGTLAALYGADAAALVRIQYGGSVKPGNMADYMGQPDIDGALVGGASLAVADFTTLVRIAAEVKGSVTLDVLDVFGPWVLVSLLLYTTRWMERWLYQHLFKVGWLFTHNLPATTIFFYLFFLPGIFLHEATVWLVAGIFNVRADRSLAWPATQSEARLKLEFVRLSKNAGKASLAVINLSPLIAGMLALYLIVVGILRLDVLVAQYAGNAESLPGMIQQVTLTPDFWLWFYVAFTIANTMFPGDMKALRGWRAIFVVLGAFIGLLFLFGLGEVVVGRVLQGPLRDAAIVLSGLLGFVIVVDLVVTIILRLIETIIEFVTGSSATYQHGKLVALTREQVKQQRAAERLQTERQAKSQKTKVVYRSVYDLPLPLPPAPGKAEAVTVERPPQPALGGGPPAPAAPGLAFPPDAD